MNMTPEPPPRKRNFFNFRPSGGSAALECRCHRIVPLLDVLNSTRNHAMHMSAPGRIAEMMALALVLFAGASTGAAAEVSGAFAINQQIGRGINIGNALEAPSEGEWGVTIRDEYFDIIKSAGFKSVRIAVCWSAHARAEKPYAIAPDFFKRTDEVITQALARGFVVILTMHHYRELYAEPSGHRERFLAIWRQIATRYKSYPAALLFEPLNEPQDRFGAAEWNHLIGELLPVIRETNPARTLLLGPVDYNDIRQLNALALPETDRNLIVSLHYYLPYQFTHQGAHWQPGSEAWLGTRWSGSEPEQRAIRDDFGVAAAWAKTNNRPICISEFGANSKADMESRARWTKSVANAAIERGFSFTYWDFCAEFFGLYDPQSKSWRKELLAAVIPPLEKAKAK
jgi:endoglucanase